MQNNLHLLIIDPQNDFCDLPTAWYAPDGLGGQIAPALPVAGAHADMLRLAALITDAGNGVQDISVTLDAHHRLDIAHPGFWRQTDGSAVAPFTEISATAVRTGAYLPRDPAALPRALSYVDALEAQGRYRLMVWPVHCEIGSWGQNVHAALHAAYNGWEDLTHKQVTKLAKGSNPWTEHYSAIKAEVPDDDDPATQLNAAFLARLEQADRVYIAGEAGSHCVKATTEHIAAHFGAQAVGKLVLLTDCISPVGGFEAQYQDFLRSMAAQGVHLATSAEVLPELLANRI